MSFCLHWFTKMSKSLFGEGEEHFCWGPRLLVWVQQTGGSPGGRGNRGKEASQPDPWKAPREGWTPPAPTPWTVGSCWERLWVSAPWEYCGEQASGHNGCPACSGPEKGLWASCWGRGTEWWSQQLSCRIRPWAHWPNFAFSFLSWAGQ